MVNEEESVVVAEVAEGAATGESLASPGNPASLVSLVSRRNRYSHDSRGMSKGAMACTAGLRRALSSYTAYTGVAEGRKTGRWDFRKSKRDIICKL